MINLFQVVSIVDVILALIGLFKFLRLMIQYDIVDDWEGSIWFELSAFLASIIVSVYTFYTPAEEYSWLLKSALTLWLCFGIHFTHKVRMRSKKRNIFVKHKKN